MVEGNMDEEYTSSKVVWIVSYYNFVGLIL